MLTQEQEQRLKNILSTGEFSMDDVLVAGLNELEFYIEMSKLHKEQENEIK